MKKIIYETHATGHWKELFKSKNKILGGHNLAEGEEICAIIDSVGSEVVFDKEAKGNKDLVVLKFQGGKVPPMALNVTNSETIALLYGNNYKQWHGKKILIHTQKVKAFGKEHDALRVRAMIPRDDDLKQYQDKLNKCNSMEELRNAFTSLPKHIQGALESLKDKRKGELA